MGNNFISIRQLDKIEKYLDGLARERKPTEKFHVINDAIKLVREVALDDDKISISYDYTNGTIVWRTYFLSIYNMDSWRKLMELTDILGVDILDDNMLYIELTIKDIFTIPKK